ncbi:MAG: 2-aminoadipate transaminase [Firmicutes bacterium ADurb.Bin193]|nr:MAG: 2-aminoadipate transaminase [Firmicutes bacterium ADurb.Bin193]
MINFEFANRVSDLHGSAIRAAFKALSRPGMISLAGGMPDPKTYPNRELSEIAARILAEKGVTALQYGITEGYAPLLEKTRARLKNAGIGNDKDSLIITSGGQQAIELVTKSLINEGDGVACENPSFIGALNAFRSYGARLYSVTVEEDGMDIEALDKTLSQNKNIKFIYTIPTFQNPSGITMSLDKRKRLLAVAKKHDVFILEDSPYWELRFAGENVPSIKSMDEDNRVLYVGSYSKTVSPGLRVGFLLGNEDLVEKAVVCKQVSDVHTSVLPQMMIDEFLSKYDIDERIKASAAINGKKCAFMHECMDRYFPDSVSRTHPEGGLFLWCDLGGDADSSAFAAACLDKNVAIVPGASAMPDPTQKTSAFRLNFSMASEAEIETGIKALGEIIKGYGR